MNPRQRRGALLLALAIIGAIAVFFSVSSYVSEVQREVGPKRLVLQLNTEATAFQPLPPESVEQVEIPEKYVPQRLSRKPLKGSRSVVDFQTMGPRPNDGRDRGLQLHLLRQRSAVPDATEPR